MSRSLARVPGPRATAVVVGGAHATAGLAAAAAVLGVLALVPLAAVAISVGGARVPLAEVTRFVAGSLILAVASTAATLALAAPLAYAVTRADAPGRWWLAAAARVPLLAPPFTAGLALLVLLGPRAEGMSALVVAQALTFAPHAYVRLAASLGDLSRAREDAAESLGAGAWTTFRRVTLPGVQPALRSTAMLAFVSSLADLGNPVLVGGGHPVVTREVYERAVAGGDPASASPLALALVVPYVVAWWLVRVRPAPAAWSEAVRGHAPPAWRPLAPGLRGALAVAGGVGATALAGAVLVVATASIVSGAGATTVSLGHWSAVTAPADARALGGSLLVATVAGAVGSIVALALAYLLARPRVPAAAPVRALAMLPALAPGVVLGLGYLIVLGAPATTAVALAAAAASVLAWKLPGALQVAGDTVGRIDPATEAVALGLGASRARTLTRVVLPPLATTAVAAFAYFFVNGLVTVATVAFLLSPAVELAAPAAMTRAAAGAVGEACALVTLLLAVVAVVVLMLRAVVGRARVAALFL